MANPVILVDPSGSDTQASGAGPPTAIFGTTDASTDGAGTVVTVTAGTDLSGVATDGSHVIFLNDTTAGARNFGKITATAGSGGATPTVTVSNAFGTTLSGKSWAIGGKRASIGSTTSRKLYENNSSNGDAMPGWAVEMQSGHTETLSSTFAIKLRSGDVTSGPIILRGAAGAATRPVLTFSNNGIAINVTASTYHHLRDFDLQNTNATKTASVGIQCGQSTGGINLLIAGIRISHSTNKFWKGIDCNATTLNPSPHILDCEIGYCASVGIDTIVPSRGFRIINCWIHDCASHGVLCNTASAADPLIVYGCIIANNGGAGIRNTNSGTAGTVAGGTIVRQCTINNNTTDGITITSSGIDALCGLMVQNNIISNNGGWGLNLSGTPDSAKMLAARAIISCNCFYSNTSGAITPSGFDTDTTTANPSFTNAAGGDYSIGTALKALGYPLGGTLPVGTTSSTYSYVDPGAAQRQEAGGGGGGVYSSFPSGQTLGL